MRKLLFVLAVSQFIVAAQATAVQSAQGLALDGPRRLAFSPVDNAVLLLDVSDPGRPSLASTPISTSGVVQDLAYDDATRRLYVATDQGQLEIWDVQAPTSPVRMSVTSLEYFGVDLPIVSIAVDHDHAYVSTGWGYLHWLDVSDPAHPKDVGFNGQGGNPSREVFVADDGFVYLAGPITVRYGFNSQGRLALAGSNYYATSYRMFAADGYAYISNGTGSLQILDARTASLPLVSTYGTNNVAGIFVDGDYAYIANGGAGLRVLDVADKTNPTEIGFDDSDSATDVIVAGGYAYVRNGLSVFRVVDVSAPDEPVVVGTFDPSASASAPTRRRRARRTVE